MNERILVVDDTPANIQTVAAILKGQGYQLSVATNGKQALEVIEKVRPDLILLDVMMPELDGIETCRRIKSTEAWRDIPVIFLTAKTETADIVKGFEIGAVDYVGKPFNAHELLARVNTHLTDRFSSGGASPTRTWSWRAPTSWSGAPSDATCRKRWPRACSARPRRWISAVRSARRPS